MDYGRFFVTTPIYYVNDNPHIGHAYSTIAADILARYWQGRGAETFFLTGVDEHGMKIAQAALKAGISPKEFVDKISDKYKEAWRALNLNYSNFIRTTDKEHEKFVQDFVQNLHDNGDIYMSNDFGITWTKSNTSIKNWKCILYNSTGNLLVATTFNVLSEDLIINTYNITNF